ncbi:hypothetical protein DL769_002860 [Monosporascus sp. CRB-8-3]|nr:hypothetical protein DL769_002860 [Monosporascus sp. CRB-8-3]
MPPVRGPLRLLLLATVLATSSATYIRSNLVFGRQDTCGGVQGLSRCAQAGLPDNFCCSKGTNCIPLAGDTTVLCCPEGSTCDSINPIVCDLNLQDATTNPRAAIKTTVLEGKLKECGSGCCPYGYSCEDGSCAMNKDQSKRPDGANPSSTTKPDPSASSEPTATATEGGSTTEVPSTDEPEVVASDSFPTAAVVGGLVGGVAGLICITALIMFLRNRRTKAARKRHDSTSSFGNIISAPQPINGYMNQRQDFLAKATTSSVATTPTQAQERFGQHSSPWSQPYARRDSEMSESSPRSHHPSAEVGGLRSLTNGRYSVPPPATPRDKRQASAGSESINVFADPSTVGGRRNTAYTTWTTIMADGDVPGLPDSPTRRRL